VETRAREGGWGRGTDGARRTTQAKLAATAVEKEFAETQLAFSKATNFDDVPPKEKHVRALVHACGGSSKDRAFVLETLARQVRKCAPWRTMLKTHVLLHRLLRECEGGVKDDFFRFLEFLSRKTYGPKEQTLFNIRYWKDEANKDAYELSGWTRAYAAYLEELCALNEFIPSLVGNVSGAVTTTTNGEARAAVANPLKDCDFATLIKVLPLVQTLVRRITDCAPTSTTLQKNAVSRYAVGLVAKDSFLVYRVMNEGIINLVDKYFETSKVEAEKGLAIFKKYLTQIEDLQRFYDSCEACAAVENAVVKLEAPPETFLKSMEEYYESAPREGLPLRERRLGAASSATANNARANAVGSTMLAVDIPANNADFISTTAALPPASSLNALDALSQLDLGTPSPTSEHDPFSSNALPAPTQPPALTPVAPLASSSSNALDFFSEPIAPAVPTQPSAAAYNPYEANPYGGAPQTAPAPQAISPRSKNPFGDNPFGTPQPQSLDKSALNDLYAKAPASPRSGRGMSSMAPPQHINPSFVQAPPNDATQQQQFSAPQLALPMAGVQYPQQYPQMGYPQQHPQMGYPQQRPQMGYSQQHPQMGYPQRPAAEPPLHPAFATPRQGGSPGSNAPSAQNSGSLI